jgi:hypothetical protein
MSRLFVLELDVTDYLEEGEMCIIVLLWLFPRRKVEINICV